MFKKLFVHSGGILILLFSALQVPCNAQGSVIEFIKGGSWCWFQDERAVIDTINSKLIIGATNMQASTDVVIYDIEKKKTDLSKRFSSLGSGKQDDHNAPSVLVTENGNYLTIWSQHYDSKHHYSIYSNGSWSAEKTIDWSKWAGGQQYDLAYQNTYYLSKEKRIYNFARSFDNRSPHFIYSDDNGQNWNFGGKLTTNDATTYNRGYYKYWGNGIDRIDLCFTEEHPRDQETSIYHGYILDRKLYNSTGDVADTAIYNKNEIPTFKSFTKVFAHGTEVNGVEMGHCWQSDICRFNDGSVAILFFARANNDTLDHRNFYARFDGKAWKTTYLGKAGRGIYNSEQDYTGLGALCPDDPSRIYISSPFNPGEDNSKAGKREIWRGITADNGVTWKWEAVTSNSSVDNFRPIVPKWKPGKEALLWFRGKYVTAQDVQTDVVGTFYNYDPVVNTRLHQGHSDDGTVYSINSFRTSLRICYQTQQTALVKMTLHSLDGKNVTALVNEVQAPGLHTLNCNTNHIPSGTFIVNFTAGNKVLLNKVTIYR